MLACLGMVMVSSPLISLARMPSSLASFLSGALMSTALRGLADRAACRSEDTCVSAYAPIRSSIPLQRKGIGRQGIAETVMYDHLHTHYHILEKHLQDIPHQLL